MTLAERAAKAARETLDRLDTLEDVQLRRRTGARSSDTGERAYAAAVSLRGRVDPVDIIVRGRDGSTRTAKHRVRTFGVAVAAGDRLTWDGGDHTALRVTGLLFDVVETD